MYLFQPVEEIMEQVRCYKRDPKHEVARILLHTDAAQTIGKIPVSVKDLGVDYLTIVGHKVSLFQQSLIAKNMISHNTKFNGKSGNVHDWGVDYVTFDVIKRVYLLTA